MTVSQTPFTCRDSTTGYATAWPCGDRTTLAASSRTKSTFSSARTGTPARKGSAASSTDRTTHTPLPS